MLKVKIKKKIQKKFFFNIKKYLKINLSERKKNISLSRHFLNYKIQLMAV
uniref:Uncharacterized protein n=1 Tax=Meloidogyne enterolobii TaxID=390850 RepID=A0A6V7V4K7_MELEN|nr:unnamed protein product [Meloidogyne enterolobii]